MILSSGEEHLGLLRIPRCDGTSVAFSQSPLQCELHIMNRERHKGQSLKGYLPGLTFIDKVQGTVVTSICVAHDVPKVVQP